MKKIYSLLFMFCFCTLANAQNTFEKIIDTLGSSGGGCVQETYDGGYILCGGSTYNNNDATVIKLDSAGTIEWAKLYTGAGADGAIYIEELPDSGYIVDGRYDVGINSKNWLLRLDKNGDTLWTKTLSADTSAGRTTASLMALSSNGNIGLTGTFQKYSPDHNDAYLIIASNTGTVNASKVYTTTSKTQGYAVCNAGQNGFVLTGSKNVSLSFSDFFLIATDSVGDTLWTKSYDNSQADVGFAIERTTDNGFIFTGVTWNAVDFKYNIYLIKTDSMGDTLWTKYYYSSIETGARSLQQTTDGGYILTGRIVNGTPINADVYLMKTDSVGDTLWTRQYGDIHADDGYFVRQTKDGGYIICGLGVIGSNGGTYLIKTDSLGNVASPLAFPDETGKPMALLLYPNPTIGLSVLRATGLKNQNYTYEIFTRQGRKVGAGKLNKPINGISDTEMDLRNLYDKYYFLVVSDKKNRFVLRTIVSRL